jgi:hypothetical protein
MVKESVDSPWKVRGEEILSNFERIGKGYKKKAAFLPPSLCHLLIGKMYSLDKLPTNGRSSTWMSAPCKRPTLRFGTPFERHSHYQAG